MLRGPTCLQRRCLTTSRFQSNQNYNFNTNPNALSFLDDDQLPNHERFRRVTAAELHSRREPPKRVKMLVRDFIDDSLYNRNYGYFSKQAVIFSPEKDFNISQMRDNMEFLDTLASWYEQFESRFSEDEAVKQVWHTPTEIFRPWYGYAIANYIISQHKIDSAGRVNPIEKDELVIYEVGAGNGTLMNNILDCIKDIDKDLYARTRYHVIEISEQLTSRQRDQLASRHQNVEIIHQSIFDWKDTRTEPCFFIAMEVMDNLSHDMIRYNMKTLEPYQGVVCIDPKGHFYEIFESINDPLILDFLRVRKEINCPSPITTSSPLWRQLRSYLPFAPNFTKGEFIPTKLLVLIKALHKHFPNHRFITSDFYTLPDVIGNGTEYLNAPVVQTRYENSMIACSTYMVQQGWFDIFFPTDFDLLKHMYKYVTSREGKVISHREFLKQNSPSLKQTTTRSGENPMLMYYENVKVFVS